MRAAARRASTLQRIHISRSANALVPGIGVCPSEELTNCEARYGEPRRTLVWTVPRILVPARCEDHVVHAMSDCVTAADGSVDPDVLARCLPERGWLVAMEGAYTVLDLRETQTAPGQITIQCDQGHAEGTFTQAPGTP